MLTMDNTEGFSQTELDQMNAEVEEILNDVKQDCIFTPHDYYSWLQYAEEKVLKKYGGA